MGSAWDFSNKMGPLIKPPTDDLKKALTSLEPGETWALQPESIHNNPYMWTPGIKWGVSAGSYTHKTEFFGPVLAGMHADNLSQAIEMTNKTGYGLTSGIESLDPREQELWAEKIEAGNLYINRGTIGAITLRQPFGGVKKSALGAGIKAGSPNYVVQFMSVLDHSMPETGIIKQEHPLLSQVLKWKVKAAWHMYSDLNEEIVKAIRGVTNYIFHMENEFSVYSDYFHLCGQDNILRYNPLGTILVRLHEDDQLSDVLARIAPSKIAGNKVIVSLPKDLENNIIEFLMGEDCKFLMQDVSVIR